VIVHAGQQNPFSHSGPNPAPFYGLLEFDTPHEEPNITSFFEHCQNNGCVEDAHIAQSEKQAKELWQLQENISESLAPHKPIRDDVEARLEKMVEFIQRFREIFLDQYPDFKSVWFGHLGDGSIHIHILKPNDWSYEKFTENSSKIFGLVYGLLMNEFEGSISAEHGIGLLKRSTNNEFVSDSEIVITIGIKERFDESQVMNSAKVI
jgi:FAD/FMN-containing dehydrogenase